PAAADAHAAPAATAPAAAAPAAADAHAAAPDTNPAAAEPAAADAHVAAADTDPATANADAATAERFTAAQPGRDADDRPRRVDPGDGVERSRVDLVVEPGRQRGRTGVRRWLGRAPRDGAAGVRSRGRPAEQRYP